MADYDDPLVDQNFRRPLVTLSKLLRKEAGGQYVTRGEYLPFMFRAFVLAVDTEGGQLENPGPPGTKVLIQTIQDSKGTRELRVPSVTGPPNPPDSLKARIVSNTQDRFFNDVDLRVYWPLFPGLQNPAPGELVYVVFEDAAQQHGLWIAKVPFNNEFDNPNQVLQRTVIEKSGDSQAHLPGDDPDDLNSRFGS